MDYDAFLAGCPSRQLLDRISDKWVALILAALGGDGPHDRGTGCAGQSRSMRCSERLRQLRLTADRPFTAQARTQLGTTR